MHLYRDFHCRPRRFTTRSPWRQRRDDEGEPRWPRGWGCRQSGCYRLEELGCQGSAIQDRLSGLYGTGSGCSGKLVLANRTNRPADTIAGRRYRRSRRSRRRRRGSGGVPELSHTAGSGRAEEYGQLGEHLSAAGVEHRTYRLWSAAISETVDH